MTNFNINQLIDTFTGGDNDDSNDFDGQMLPRLVLCKAKIDRWNNFTTDIILNPAHQTKIKDIASRTGLGSNNGNVAKLFGANLNYLDECPIDRAILLSLGAIGKFSDIEHPDRCVAVCSI